MFIDGRMNSPLLPPIIPIINKRGGDPLTPQWIQRYLLSYLDLVVRIRRLAISNLSLVQDIVFELVE
jgi:hypothetical protein